MNKANDPKFFYGWIVLAGCFLLSVSFAFFYTYSPFFTALQNEFGWTRETTSWVATIATVVYTIAAVLVGWLTDKYGPRPIIAISAVLLGAGLALCSQVHALWQLILFFGVIAALGTGIAYSLPTATVQRWFVKRRGLVLAIQMCGIGVGTAALAPIAAHLIVTHGWRMTYVVMGIIGFVVLAIAAFLVVRTPEEKGLKPYGVTQELSTKPAAPPPKEAGLTGLTTREALKTKAFWMAWGIHLFASIPLLIVMVHIVPHCEDMGISKVAASGALGLIAFFGIAGRLIGGTVADRIGFNRTLGISLALCGAMMIFLIPIKSVWMIYLFAVIYGIGYGGKSATLPGLAGHLMGTRSLPMLMGIIVTAWAVAGLIGPPIAGHIWDITQSYNVAFIIGAISYGIGTVLGLTVKPPKKVLAMQP